MIESIKITSLNNIGSNLSFTSVFPVVDINGTPITNKANLQIIGNYILSQAGGANFVQAAQATLAQSVTNAAQPNITSVGTLTSLAVSGNANISGNLNIAVNNLRIPGGTNGYVLQTDGAGNLTWTAQTGGGGGNGSPGGSNTQVQFNDAGTFGGNSGFTYNKTTSTLSVGNIALPGNGIVNGANGNISITPAVNGVVNITANDTVMDHVWTFESDGTLTFPTNRLFINGDVNVLGTNSAVIQSNNETPLNLISSGDNSAVAMLWIEDFANINSSNISGVYANPTPGARGVRIVTGNTGNYNNWNFENNGNMILPGNTFAVKYANGTQVSLSGTYGNSNVATFLASYGSNTISTTGNVTVGNIIGNGQALRSLNGANVTGTVPVANVAQYVNVQVANSNTTTYSLALVDWIAGNHRIEADLNNLKFNANTHTLTTGALTVEQNIRGNGALQLQGLANGNTTINIGSGVGGDIDMVSNLGNINLYTANNSPWTFDQTGNLTLPGNTFAVKYANGTSVPLGGGNVSQLTNGDESFALDADGNVVFDGPGPGGVNRGLVWNYGVGQSGLNSEVRQDGDGLTVRAWTENGGGANGYSAPVRIVTNQSGNEKQWIFDGQGNLTMPGNLVMANGIIQSATISPAFDSAITGITTGNPTVIVTLIDLVFSGPYSGTVTISGVTGTTEANGTWGYQAVEANELQLFTDATLTTPVDGTSWTAYVSGGDAVGASDYTSLTVQGGNVSISSNDKDWVFNTNGAVIFPTLTVDIHNGGNQQAQTLQFGDASQQAIITGPTPAVDTAAQRLIIQGQRGSGLGEGGDVYLWGGDSDVNGGDIKIYAGDADVSGSGGYVNIDGGSGVDGGGQLSLTGGYSANGQGGTVYVTAGNGADAGDLNLSGGQSSGAGNDGGNANLAGGYGANNGGAVTLQGGISALGLANYGNVYINSGASSWAFDNSGNLTLPTNTFNVNYANGTPVSLGSAALGNITVDNVTLQGVSGYSGGIQLSASPDDTANLKYLQVRSGDFDSHIHFDTGNNDAYDQYFGNDNKFLKLGLGIAGNVSIGTYQDGGVGQLEWIFDSNGNLVLAGGNSLIQSFANSSLDPLNPNVSTMVFTPDANYSSQALVLDPTAPGHIHLRSPGANIDEPYANLFLGGENTSFEIGAFYGATPNAYVHSGGNTWTFASDGNLIFPRDANINTDPYLQIQGGATPTIISIDSSLAGPANLAVSADYLNYSGFNGNKIVLHADTGEMATDANMVLTTNGANVGNTYSWTFDNAGNLTLPGNTFAINYANGVQVSLGGGNVSNISNGNSNVNIATANGNVTIAAAGNNVMTITGTGANITGTANITGNVSLANLALSSNAGQIVFNTTAYISGNANSLNRDGSILLSPYTGAGSNFAGVIIGGAGRLLSPGGSVHQIFNSNDVTFQVAIKNITGLAATSTTSGALQITGGGGFSGNVYVGGSLVRTGAVTSTAWTSNGIGLRLPTAVYTDNSTAAGTQASSYVHAMDAPTLSFSNAVTVTNAATLYVAAPAAGTNATITSSYAMIANGASQMLGTANTGISAVVAGVTNTILPNTVASFSANVNSYTQVTLQNKSTGADATADYIVTADNGSDTVNYIDLGIINSGYDANTPTNSLGNIVFAADGYLYAQGNTSNASQSGGNLAIGTTVPGKNVKIFVGGVNNSAIMANISNTGMTVNGNVVANNFSGNISITGNVTGTSPNVSLVAGSYTYTFDNAGILTLPATGGNEGGEIDFIKAPNSSLSGNTVVVDQYVDRIRFFEGGGTNRGAYIDLTQAGAAVSTLLNNRVSGLVNAGTFVTMDNIKATVTSSAPRGLSLATVSGTFSYNIAGNFATAGGPGASVLAGQTLTTTATSSIFGWGFTASGDLATYVLTDTTNSRCYRITLQIGASFNNNSIIIERLI